MNRMASCVGTFEVFEAAHVALRTLLAFSQSVNCIFWPIGMLNWLVAASKLHKHRETCCTIMVYKSLNGLAPDYLAEMFIDRSNITNYTLRDTSGKLAMPQPRTHYLKNSFSYSGAVLWNSLPSDLRQAISLQKFKADCSNLFR